MIIADATGALKKTRYGFKLTNYVPCNVDTFTSKEILHVEGNPYQAVISVKVLALVLQLQI